MTSVKYCFAILFIWFPVYLFSAPKEAFPVSTINSELLKNSHTVIRKESMKLEVKNLQSVLMDYTIIKTILNKNGEQQVVMPVVYNEFQRIINFSGTIYDAEGKKVRNVKEEEIHDFSSISNYSLYEKSRTKLSYPVYQTYPFTIEYNLKIEFKQTLSLPGWNFNEYNVALENLDYQIIVPNTFNLKYKSNNLINENVIKKEEKDFVSYAWKQQNLLSRVKEPLSVNNESTYPNIRINLSNFSVADVPGENTNWNSFGKWTTKLITGKNNLPESTVQEIRRITSDCKNDEEKIKKVYEFVQKKTRYVSIQIGIGGWEPFDALTVDNTSYGDCKALTNYTRSLLEAAGINAFYTLIKGGDDDMFIDTSFVCNQFNHVLLCIPAKTDTMWLECTNQRLPAGFQGSFTDNRYALIVDGENSRLIKSRKYKAEENCVVRNSLVKFTDLKSAEASVITTSSGIEYENKLGVMYADEANRKKMIESSLSLPSFELKDFKLKEERNRIPVITESINLYVDNFIVNQPGDLRFIPIGFLVSEIAIPARVRNRKTDFTVLRSSVEIDSIEYELPAELTCMSVPEKVLIESEFGSYNLSCNLSSGKLKVYRYFKQNEGQYLSSKYEMYREFLENVDLSDRKLIELKKK